LINYNGILADANGRPLRHLTGVTFLLYKDQQGGAPLWMETQNVMPDSTGHYTALLGATKSEGLPLDLFADGQAHWLATQVVGQVEQPRVLLVAVPYALKAKDAETIGGLPASAFVMAAAPISPGVSPADSVNGASTASSAPLPTSSNVTTTGGTVNALPLWTTATNVQSSAISQTGTGTAAKLTLRGTIVIPATGAATAAGGKTSEPINITASTFNSASSAAVGQTFQLKTEPINSNTANPDATFNLLFGHAASTPAETGLAIASNGQITFAPGQTFPGAGTISGVIAGTDLTGGGTSGNVTLNLDTTKVPQLGTANTFTGPQTVTGNITSTGQVTAASFKIGANLFAFGTYAKENAFLGFAGNTAITGISNTGAGYLALHTNTTGTQNTATGANALSANTTGSWNTATGVATLLDNTSGNYNTAFGVESLLSNTTGSNNAALGGYSLFTNTTGSNNTAAGTNALTSNTIGNQNTATGMNALTSNKTGNDNTGSGFKALYTNSSGGQNTAVGSLALYNTTAIANTANGYTALAGNTTGSNNSAFGWQAGYNANPNVTGSNNTFLGANSGPGVAAAINNATAIGANAVVSTSNSLVLGGAGVNVGIGTPAPTANLEVAGNLRVSGSGHGITFPDNSVQTTASGNISGVIAGPGLTGGGTSGTVTLNVDTTKVPQLNAANVFTGNQTVNGNVGTTGVVAASSFQIGGSLFGFGSLANYNAFLGFAGNTTTTGANNTASGAYALSANTTGYQNMADGTGALVSNTSGFQNTGDGFQALSSNTEGSSNTATGIWALYSNTTGSQNTADGSAALYYNSVGNDNTASGIDALDSNTTGSNNAAFGAGALANNPTGSNNIALGSGAASNLTSGSNNIHIGNLGLSSESNTIRIGTGGAGGHTAFYVAGVLGTNIAAGSPLYISGTGQLGVVSSSRRYKDDIQDMGDASAGLFKLRPVTFRYKQPAADGSKPRQFGLIAEEVAEVYPDAVGYNAQGQPDSVEYHKINAMLINEVQRQNREIQEQSKEIEELKASLAEVKAIVRTQLGK
jgi:hypothetical protein